MNTEIKDRPQIEKGDKMSDKHILEYLRENFLANLSEMKISTALHNDVVAKLDRSINLVHQGQTVESAKNGQPKPGKKELTRGQKIAQSRARNKKKREAEAAGESTQEERFGA